MWCFVSDDGTTCYLLVLLLVSLLVILLVLRSKRGIRFEKKIEMEQHRKKSHAILEKM